MMSTVLSSLRQKKLILPFLLLVLVPMVLYYPSLANPFYDMLDDRWLVTENYGIRDLSLHGWLNLFLHDTRDLHYMPVTYVSYSIDYALFGMNAFWLRMHNLVLHVVSGLLLFVFIRLLTQRRNIALLIAFLYVIQPMNMEAVVWAACRKQALFYSFMLASMIAYLLFLREKEGRRRNLLYLTAIVLWVISVMAKATSITLPGVFVLLYIHERRTDFRLKHILLQLLPMLPLVALFWYLNTEANARNFLVRDFSYTYLQHFIMAAYSYSFYWLKSSFPFPLAVFYPAPSEHYPLPWQYGAMAVLTLLFFLLMLYHLLRRQYTLFFALAYYTITILPMLDLMFYPLGDLPMLVSNRYYYHASLGILLYLVLLADILPVNKKWKMMMALVYSVVLLVLFELQLPAWKTEISVFENDARYYPSEDFLYKLALLYDEKGQDDKAFQCLERADTLGTDIWINNAWVYYQKRAALYAKAGKYDRALDDIETALAKKDYKTPHADSLLLQDKLNIRAKMLQTKPEPGVTAR